MRFFVFRLLTSVLFTTIAFICCFGVDMAAADVRWLSEYCVEMSPEGFVERKITSVGLHDGNCTEYILSDTYAYLEYEPEHYNDFSNDVGWFANILDGGNYSRRIAFLFENTEGIEQDDVYYSEVEFECDLAVEEITGDVKVSVEKYTDSMLPYFVQGAEAISMYGDITSTGTLYPVSAGTFARILSGGSIFDYSRDNYFVIGFSGNVDTYPECAFSEFCEIDDVILRVHLLERILDPFVDYITSNSFVAGAFTQNVENPHTAGICWNTVGTPTISDSYSDNSEYENGWFARNAVDLEPNTTYHIRAYVIHDGTYYYSDEITAHTLPDPADYNTNALLLRFEPTQILGSPSFYIVDQGSETNHMNYVLNDTSYDGFTVWISDVDDETKSNFYPIDPNWDSIDVWIPPPISGMYAEGECSHLPFYYIYNEAGESLGVDACVLYTMTTISISMGLGFMALLLVGNVFLSVAIMIAIFGAFMSTGVMPMWIMLVFAMMAFSFMYIARRV